MTASRVPAERPASLAELRHIVAQLEGRAPMLDAGDGGGEAWRFDVPAIDRAVGGALPIALHALAAAAPGDVPATHGFALALASRAGRSGGCLWVTTAQYRREWGLPYGPGLARYGCDPGQLLLVEARRPVEAGWALEEALRSGAFALLIGAGVEADFTASRRLALAAADHATPCLLIDAPGPDTPSAAATRWRVAVRPSAGDAFDAQAPGSPRWHLDLIRVRGGAPTGPWELDWDEQTHRFALAAAPADRAATPSARPVVQAVAGGLRAERGRAAWA